MTLLPSIDASTYEQLWSDDRHWLPAVHAIAARHGLSQAPARYRSGTALAYRLDDLVLKLYPPFAAHDCQLEASVLARLNHVAELPAPRHVADGELEGYAYLLMTRLAGEPIDALWPSLSPVSRVELARAIGALTRALHGARADALPRADQDFAAFRTAMRARALSHHVGRGFPVERKGELSALLVQLDREPEPSGPHVLLHTELGPGHLLVDQGRISGLFDFAEARSGPAEYDFAAVGLFVTRGDRAAFAAFLDSYGQPAELRGPALVRRLMRHALLHQYGHLSFYLKASPVPHADGLGALAEHWFAH
jgi:hygromycin-B 7''-O-kinase